jgi:hypothetical protein
MREASILGEDVLIETLDLNRATGKLARQSLRAEFLRGWWEEGMKRVEHPVAERSPADRSSSQ